MNIMPTPTITNVSSGKIEEVAGETVSEKTIESLATLLKKK